MALNGIVRIRSLEWQMRNVIKGEARLPFSNLRLRLPFFAIQGEARLPFLILHSAL